MSKVNELSVEEIIGITGLAIKTNEYGIVFRANDEAMQKLKRILRRLERDSEYTKEDMQNAIIELLKEFDSIVDKEKLVMLTAYNLKRSLEIGAGATTDKNKNGMKKDLLGAAELLKDFDVKIVFPEYIRGSRLVGRINVIDSRELLQVIKSGKSVKTLTATSSRQKNRYKEVMDSIGGLEGVAGLITFEDIENTIASDKEIGLQISGQITNNIYQRFQADNAERDILAEAEQNPDEIEEEISRGGYQNREMDAALEANCKYVNIDKLLLLIGYRIIQDLELDRVQISEGDGKDIFNEKKEYCMQVLEAIVKKSYNQIAKGTTIEGIDPQTEEEYTYTEEQLKVACERFRNGRYYKEAEVSQVEEDLKAGRMLCKDVPEDLYYMIDFDDKTMTMIMTHYTQNLVFLIQSRSGKEEIIYYYMNEMEKIPNEVLSELSQKEEIDIHAIMDFFEQNKISADQIANTGISMHISQDLINSRIKELYSRIQNLQIEQEEKAKDIALFNRYASLYRMLYVEEKSEEEIAKSGFTLVSSFEDELSGEALQDLYQHSLITLDIAADWGVDLTEMLEAGQIKPTDLKKLYANGIVQMEQIRNIIKYGSISNDEKQDLIYATFDGDTLEEEQIRVELIQLLTIGEEYRGESRITGAKRGSTSVGKWRNFVTDPQTRWKLISLLDKDYSKRVLPKGKQVLDGHRVFLLPNQDRIIIEKMYEKRRGEMVSAYGSATYAMPTVEFYDHLEDIIKDGAINRSFLYEMADMDIATPIMHSKNWGKNIMKYFGIDANNERYTAEEYQEILNAVERVTNSRRERE